MHRTKQLIWALAILRLILPFLLVDSFYQLHRDEYLYLAEGRHPAWGFMEVPPMLSWMAWISHQFGASLILVKIWPALIGSATFVLLGYLILSLGGRSLAIVFAFLPFLFTGMIRLFYFFHPNFLDVFFWTLNAYTLIRYTQTKQNRWLYLFAIGIGLGMLSKYSVAFYTAALLGGLLLTKERSVFRNKHLYLAGMIAVIILLPNLIWQYQHNFPLAQHMQELQEEQLQFISPLSFIMSQLLMFLPCIYIWVSGLCYTGFNSAAKSYRFIAWAYVLVIALLMVLHGKDYYAIGAYPVLFAFGAYYLEQVCLQRKWVAVILIAIPASLGSWIMPLLLPMHKPDQLAAWYAKTKLNETGSFKWEDQQQHPLPQDFADMIGWRELASKTAAVYHQLSPAEQKQTLVYCRGYFTAGALNYYGPSLGLPEVYSDNASFLFWMPDTYPFRNLILVGKSIPGKDDIVFQQFAKMELRDSIHYPLFRETGMKIILFSGGNDSLNSITTRAVAGLKSRYKRQ